MTRGGAGRNQGRKKAIPDARLRIVIGARCVEVRRLASESGARARLDQEWAGVKAVREAVAKDRKRHFARIQQLIDAGLKQSARAENKKFAAWEKIAAAKIQDAWKRNRGRKNVAISHARYRPKPLTRLEIYEIVSKEFGVSPRRVRACWIEHNKLFPPERV